MINKTLLLALVVLTAAGCTSTTHFQWGNYEQNLYDYYHEAAVKEKVIADHIKMVESHAGTERKIAPGMYAEAGTFYLEKGETENAVKYYKLEKEAWPESAKLMDQLISTIESNNNATENKNIGE